MTLLTKINKPKFEDLKSIGKILSQWTEAKEVKKYAKRILDEINGQTQFGMHFWVARKDDQVIGVAGIANPLPKVLHLAKTDKPGELKILYIDKNNLRMGVGKKLTGFLEKEAKNQGYSELIVRSAEKYRDSAWGFYDKQGYKRVGKVIGGDNLREMLVFGKLL